jgi:hypothetical protein
VILGCCGSSSASTGIKKSSVNTLMMRCCSWSSRLISPPIRFYDVGDQRELKSFSRRRRKPLSVAAGSRPPARWQKARQGNDLHMPPQGCRGGETRLRAARRASSEAASSTRLPGYSTATIRLPAVGHRGSCRPPPMRASHRCAARDSSRFHRRAARDFATGRRTAGHETRERDGRMIGGGRYFGYCEI